MKMEKRLSNAYKSNLQKHVTVSSTSSGNMIWPLAVRSWSPIDEYRRLDNAFVAAPLPVLPTIVFSHIIDGFSLLLLFRALYRHIHSVIFKFGFFVHVQFIRCKIGVKYCFFGHIHIRSQLSFNLKISKYLIEYADFSTDFFSIPFSFSHIQQCFFVNNSIQIIEKQIGPENIKQNKN